MMGSTVPSTTGPNPPQAQPRSECAAGLLPGELLEVGDIGLGYTELGEQSLRRSCAAFGRGDSKRRSALHRRRWNRPLPDGMARTVEVFAPPPDWPNIMTLAGSPPKVAMLSRTHSSEATRSITPADSGVGELGRRAQVSQMEIAETGQAMVHGDHYDVAEPG